MIVELSGGLNAGLSAPSNLPRAQEERTTECRGSSKTLKEVDSENQKTFIYKKKAFKRGKPPVSEQGRKKAIRRRYLVKTEERTLTTRRKVKRVTLYSRENGGSRSD